jgi:alpha-tubulin suppressor-like RCC1 family protein
LGHACALLENGDLRCWGYGFYGELGNGSMENIGDDETPAEAPPVDLGVAVERVWALPTMTCVEGADGELYCWGNNGLGELGLGHTENVGQHEPIRGIPPVMHWPPEE